MGYFGLKQTGEIKLLELRLEAIRAASEVLRSLPAWVNCLAVLNIQGMQWRLP